MTSEPASRDEPVDASDSGRLDAVSRHLQRLQQGDASGLDDLLAETYDGLRRMASRALKHYPGLDRWTETDDIWQTAAVRLSRALQETVPESPLHFYRLAALQIRRTLIDMLRKLNGPLGIAANHDTRADFGSEPSNARQEPAGIDETNNPVLICDWAEFHEQVASLPERERETFDLLWYNELTQAEAAKVLGIDVRSIKRRWRAARLLLQQRREGERPGID